jgi:hypothetical protein
MPGPGRSPTASTTASSFVLLAEELAHREMQVRGLETGHQHGRIAQTKFLDDGPEGRAAVAVQAGTGGGFNVSKRFPNLR